MTPAAIIPEVLKIAVLRANALGDCVVIMPALQAIKAAYPTAELILLAKPWHQAYFSARPSPIDRVIVIPVSNNIREEGDQQENPQELDAFFARMRKAQFDIAIHFQGNGRSSNPFISKLGARLTVGVQDKGTQPLDRSIPFVYRQNEVLRFLEVAALIGAPPVELEPRMAVTADDLAEARRELGMLAEQRFVVIHPGAKDIRRTWPAAKFAHVADCLIRQGWPVVLTGDQLEQLIVEQVKAHMSGRALDLCGKLTLSGLTGLLSLSALVISNDTGALHLARAVGASTVGIFWFANVVNWGPLTRTQHRLVISWQKICPGCGMFPNDPWPFEPKTAQCEHPFSFVEMAHVEEVCEQALDLLRYQPAPISCHP